MHVTQIVARTFQSTPPRGGRPAMQSLSSRSSVSIHAPARGATIAEDARRPSAGFNPRPRAGGDARRGGEHGGQAVFQSTPPRGGRRLMPWHDSGASGFQSTPPRGGRRRACVMRAVCGVSIHAPARGATLRTTITHSDVSIHAPARGATRIDRAIAQRSVSIHAPARGATRCARSSCAVIVHAFQSTPPRGGRPTTSQWP